MAHFPAQTFSLSPLASQPVAATRRTFAGVESTAFQQVILADNSGDQTLRIYSDGQIGALLVTASGTPLAALPVVGGYSVGAYQAGSWQVVAQVASVTGRVDAQPMGVYSVAGLVAQQGSWQVAATQQGSWQVVARVDTVTAPYSVHATVQSVTGRVDAVPTGVYSVAGRVAQQGSWQVSAAVDTVTTPYSVHARVTQANTAEPFVVVVVSQPPGGGGAAPTSVYAIQQGSWVVDAAPSGVYSVAGLVAQAGSWSVIARVETVTTPYSVHATVQSVTGRVDALPTGVYSVAGLVAQQGSWQVIARVETVMAPYSVHAAVQSATGLVGAQQVGSWSVVNSALQQTLADIYAALAAPLTVTPVDPTSSGTVRTGSGSVVTLVASGTPAHVYSHAYGGLQAVVLGAREGETVTAVDCFFNTGALKTVVSPVFDTGPFRRFVLALSWATSGTDPAANVRVVPQWNFTSSVGNAQFAGGSWYDHNQAPFADIYQSPAGISSGFFEALEGPVLAPKFRLLVQGESCSASAVVTCVARVTFRS